jgi:DNA processing protein
METDRQTKIALLALNSVKGLGPVRIRALIDQYGSPNSLFEAEGRGALAQWTGAFSEETAEPRALLDSAEKRLMENERLGIAVLTWDDSGYPPLLREIYAPPPVLFVKGKTESFTQHACGVVGTRRLTQYGRSAAAAIVKQLVEKQIAIVSGLALGIDTAAHQACLDSGGTTIAVLGSGLDRIYPAANKNLAERIAETGALVSEFDLGTQPETFHFPRRNRIISGLSAGVLVVEAPEKSGSLITANYALQQGRDVFAVPGSIFSEASNGTFNLLKNGAIPVKSGADICDNIAHLHLAGVSVAGPGSNGLKLSMPLDLLSSAEKLVLDAISDGSERLDTIAEKSGKPVFDLFPLLLNLELKGAIRQVAGQRFVRV